MKKVDILASRIIKLENRSSYRLFMNLFNNVKFDKIPKMIGFKANYASKFNHFIKNYHSNKFMFLSDNLQKNIFSIIQVKIKYRQIFKVKPE